MGSIVRSRSPPLRTGVWASRARDVLEEHGKGLMLNHVEAPSPTSSPGLQAPEALARTTEAVVSWIEKVIQGEGGLLSGATGGALRKPPSLPAGGTILLYEPLYVVLDPSLPPRPHSSTWIIHRPSFLFAFLPCWLAAWSNESGWVEEPWRRTHSRRPPSRGGSPFLDSPPHWVPTLMRAGPGNWETREREGSPSSLPGFSSSVRHASRECRSGRTEPSGSRRLRP